MEAWIKHEGQTIIVIFDYFPPKVRGAKKIVIRYAFVNGNQKPWEDLDLIADLYEDRLVAAAHEQLDNNTGDYEEYRSPKKSWYR
jgi:hypothetical protein